MGKQNFEIRITGSGPLDDIIKALRKEVEYLESTISEDAAESYLNEGPIIETEIWSI